MKSVENLLHIIGNNWFLSFFTAMLISFIITIPITYLALRLLF